MTVSCERKRNNDGEIFGKVLLFTRITPYFLDQHSLVDIDIRILVINIYFMDSQAAIKKEKQCLNFLCFLKSLNWVFFFPVVNIS